MGIFERYLSVWVGLCIVAGVVLGSVVPDVFQMVAGWEYAHVNLAVAVFIWLASFVGDFGGGGFDSDPPVPGEHHQCESCGAPTDLVDGLCHYDAKAPGESSVVVPGHRM